MATCSPPFAAQERRQCHGDAADGAVPAEACYTEGIGRKRVVTKEYKDGLGDRETYQSINLELCF